MRKPVAVAGALLVVALLAYDPYSYGRIGGDILIPYHPWQQLVAVGFAILTISAVTLYALDRPAIALAVAGLELALFVCVNVVYLTRDGSTRLVVGYGSSLIPFATLAIGLLLRTALVFGYRSRVRALRYSQST